MQVNMCYIQYQTRRTITGRWFKMIEATDIKEGMKIKYQGWEWTITKVFAAYKVMNLQNGYTKKIIDQDNSLIWIEASKRRFVPESMTVEWFFKEMEYGEIKILNRKNNYY